MLMSPGKIIYPTNSPCIEFTHSSTIIGKRGLIQRLVRHIFHRIPDGVLPIRIDGRPLVKKVICDAFAVAYDEMEAEHL